MLDVVELKTAIQEKNATKIAKLMKEHDLVIKDNKIAGSKDACNRISAFWDKRQLVKKITLNSLKIGRICQ